MSGITQPEHAHGVVPLSDIVETNGSIVAGLADFNGARLRAKRMVQDFGDIMRVLGARATLAELGDDAEPATDAPVAPVVAADREPVPPATVASSRLLRAFKRLVRLR